VNPAAAWKQQALSVRRLPYRAVLDRGKNTSTNTGKDVIKGYLAQLAPGEKTLQTVVAEKWLQVLKNDTDTLEGLYFDRHRNLPMVGMQSV
jgi:hypothetical protein